MIQVKTSPNLLESGTELQDSGRSSKKPWVIVIAVGLTLTIIFSGLLYYLLQPKDSEICWAQASLDNNTEAADLSKAEVWKWSKIPTFCMKQAGNQKPKITQSGKFLVYAQVKRKSKSDVPFAIQLKRQDEVLRKSRSEEDILVLMGIFHLNEGDELNLDFNDENPEYIEKNSTQTYWGILRIPPYNS